jgi:RNA polymerase sigma factor (sigma-70 family)
MDHSGEELFLESLPYIESVVAYLCRKGRFSSEDSKDFSAEVKAKLMANDYEVFRKFQEKSSLRTYLLAVIQNAFRDRLDKILGKWRHSAVALRLGPVAQRIEELDRDGFSFDEICHILRAHDKVTLTDAELEDIRGQLRFRVRRRSTGEEALFDIESGDLKPEDCLLRAESLVRLRRALAAAKTALDHLPAEDRMLFLTTKVHGVSVAKYARARRLDAKEIYRRLEKIRAILRAELERQGFRKEELDELFQS